MIFGGVGPDAVHCRVLTPSWAFQPKSGAGAAAKGGRFDRPGTHAVYLSTTPETAVAEYGQAEHLFSPGTLAAYRVTLARVVDFSGGYSPAWDALWREWDCPWKDLWFRQRIAPPTWEMADRVLASGASGLAQHAAARVRAAGRPNRAVGACAVRCAGALRPSPAVRT